MTAVLLEEETGRIEVVPVTKLSVSLDEDLAAAVRDAAEEDGLTVSAWMARAAQAKVRNRLLRIALDAMAEEAGPIDIEDARRTVADMRRNAIWTGLGQK